MSTLPEATSPVKFCDECSLPTETEDYCDTCRAHEHHLVRGQIRNETCAVCIARLLLSQKLAAKMVDSNAPILRGRGMEI